VASSIEKKQGLESSPMVVEAKPSNSLGLTAKGLITAAAIAAGAFFYMRQK